MVFWLFYRRLEEGIFDWPDDTSSPLKITGRQFKWLLEGLSIDKNSAHMQVSARKPLFIPIKASIIRTQFIKL